METTLVANSRPRPPSFTSFKGTFKFPKLNKPDTKFKADGEFSVKLVGRIDDPAVLALIAKLEPLYLAAEHNAVAEFAKLSAVARKKLGQPTMNPLYTEVLDETTEQPTGDVEFKFARAASGTYKSGPKTGQKWHATIGIFDAKGVPVLKGPDIYGGTIGKVSFEVGLNQDGQPGYFIPGTGAAGLSLRLQAVQVLDLVSGGQRTAAGYGFGEEDGYAYDPKDDTTETSEGNKAAAEDDGSGDF